MLNAEESAAEEPVGWPLSLSLARKVLTDSQELHGRFSDTYRQRHQQGKTTEEEHDVHAKTCLIMEELRTQMEMLEGAVAADELEETLDCLEGMRLATLSICEEYGRLPDGIYLC